MRPRRYGWFFARRWLVACALVAVSGLHGCKTQEDAAAASQQMAETAATMQRYYATLELLTRRTEEVQRAQQLLNGVPFDAEALQQLESIGAELHKRSLLAQDVAVLASSFAEISNGAAVTEAVHAAADLNTQLIAIKVASDGGPTGEVLQKAVAALVLAVRAHDEVRAAKVLNPVLLALCGFFDAEKSVYVSWGNSYYIAAASNATALIDKDQIATGEWYRSSAEPFGLSVDLTDSGLKAAARGELKNEVQLKLAERERENVAAADALSDALHHMQGRIDTVARHKALRVRMPPLSLEGVKIWIAEIQKQTGEKA